MEKTGLASPFGLGKASDPHAYDNTRQIKDSRSSGSGYDPFDVYCFARLPCSISQ